MTTSVLNQIFKNKFQFPEKVVPPKNTVMDQAPPPFTFSGNPPNVEVEAVSLFGGQVTITR